MGDLRPLAQDYSNDLGMRCRQSLFFHFNSFYCTGRSVVSDFLIELIFLIIIT